MNGSLARMDADKWCDLTVRPFEANSLYDLASWLQTLTPFILKNSVLDVTFMHCMESYTMKDTG